MTWHGEIAGRCVAQVGSEEARKAVTRLLGPVTWWLVLVAPAPSDWTLIDYTSQRPAPGDLLNIDPPGWKTVGAS